MKNLSDKQIEETYSLIKHYHKEYLEKHGVVMPNLKRGNAYTKDALTLVYLTQDYPDTKIVTKKDLTEFIQQYYPDTLDVQQARHLGAQKGWYILSGTRNDNASTALKQGEYKLETLEICYPGFTAERRNEVVDNNYWESLKKQYEYKCACCGSKEGEPHRYWKNTTTTLQKGHKNPNKPLEAGNIIPQCEKCNRPDRNYWIYDDKGRVTKIANAKVIDNCSLQVKKDMYARLYSFFNGVKPENI